MNLDYEIRLAAEAFADIPAIEVNGEMLNLARQIIGPRRRIEAPKRKPPATVAALLEARRRSAAQHGARPARAKGKGRPRTAARKAG